MEEARDSSTPFTVDDLLDLLLQLRTTPDASGLEIDARSSAATSGAGSARPAGASGQ